MFFKHGQWSLIAGIKTMLCPASLATCKSQTPIGSSLETTSPLQPLTRHSRKSRLRAFTLIELMIVASIVGITVALSGYPTLRYLHSPVTPDTLSAIGGIQMDASGFPREIEGSSSYTTGSGADALSGISEHDPMTGDLHINIARQMPNASGSGSDFSWSSSSISVVDNSNLKFSVLGADSDQGSLDVDTPVDFAMDESPVQVELTYTTNSPQESYTLLGTWQMKIDENSSSPVSSSLQVGTDSYFPLVEVEAAATVNPEGGYIINSNTSAVPERCSALMFVMGGLVLCSRHEKSDRSSQHLFKGLRIMLRTSLFQIERIAQKGNEMGRLWIFAGLALCCFASTSKASVIGIDFDSDPNGWKYFPNNSDTIGWEFSVAEDTLVDGLGFWDLDAWYAPTTVGLWDTSGTLLGSVHTTSVSDPAVTKSDTGVGQLVFYGF